MSNTKATHKDHPAVTQALPGLTASFQAGNYAHAISAANTLIESAPNDARIHDFISSALALNMNRDRAAHHALTALALNPNDPALAKRTISVLQRAGNYDAALAHTERTLYQTPTDPTLNHLKINLMTDLGKHRNAARALDKLTKGSTPILNTATPMGALSYALLAARLSPAVYKPADIIAKLQPLLTNDPAHANLPEPMRKAAHFELARLLERESDYDNAFATYERANAFNTAPWDPDAHSSRVTKLIQAAPHIDSLPESTYTHTTKSGEQLTGKNLIFILGMMRSGSSLLEQILAQLPDITPTDEQPTLLQTITAIEQELNPNDPLHTFPMPLSADRYTQDHINTLAKNALTRYEELTQTEPNQPTRYITDKQTEHYHILPLLPKIFPGCTIIHTNRDPIDTCLSNYTQSFAQPHPQTANLTWIAQFHNDHDRLMQAWRELEQKNQSFTIHETNYATLVTNPEEETKRLAQILNIQWTPKVLDFHKSKRTVATASQDQVRQPLYTTSVGRAARFHTDQADHLAPLRATLNTQPNN